jgi:DNA-binding transcriptional LysR family regulator
MASAASLQTLQVFLAVAQKRSFTQAARELGVTPSAVSQAVRQLEAQVGVALLSRTTRSVALTEAGRAVLEGAGPGIAQALAALERATAGAGELAGQLRISVPQLAVPLILDPVLPRFLTQHRRVQLEVAVDDRLVDVVGEGFDAGIRFSDSVQRDMVRVKLIGPLRFLVAGAPSYLARRGTPRRPEDLLEHDCIGFRSTASGALYAWELEQGRRRWRIPVRGQLVTNDLALMASLAGAGLGLAYLFEPCVRERVRSGALAPVLERFVPQGTSLSLYFPGRTRLSPLLRAFIDTIHRVLPAAPLAGS